MMTVGYRIRCAHCSRVVCRDTYGSQLEHCLKHVFSKYCTPPPPAASQAPGQINILTPPEGAYLTPEGLDAWARDTNGAPFTKETKDELVEFLDVTDDGGLTCVIERVSDMPSAESNFGVDLKDSCRYISCRRRMTRKKLGEIW